VVCKQSDLLANGKRCKIVVVCQSVEKSDHGYVMMAHDVCFKKSRIVISSPDPLRGTSKSSWNSPQAWFFQQSHRLVKRVQ